MATKTISIDLAAYHRLAGARLTAKESFSQVIRRAEWPRKKTCGALLAALPGLPMVDESILGELEEAQSADAPPDDPRA